MDPAGAAAALLVLPTARSYLIATLGCGETRAVRISGDGCQEGRHLAKKKSGHRRQVCGIPGHVIASYRSFSCPVSMKIGCSETSLGLCRLQTFCASCLVCLLSVLDIEVPHHSHHSRARESEAPLREVSSDPVLRPAGLLKPSLRKTPLTLHTTKTRLTLRQWFNGAFQTHATRTTPERARKGGAAARGTR